MYLTDAFRLRGMNSSWRGARVGKIASALLDAPTASPVIVLDEFDKPAPIHRDENPLDVLHSFLEEENAKAFVDDYLEFPLRADRIIWIALANDVLAISPSILDRLLVLEIPDPSEEHLEAIINSIYAAANARYSDRFSPGLSADIRQRLLTLNSRRIGRLFDLSFARAAADGRFELRVADIAESEGLLAEAHLARGRVGFRTR